MNEQEWLKKASKFDLGTCKYHNRPLTIEVRKQMNDSDKWVLKINEWCLGSNGKFIFEPRPSSRTKEFIKLTRFNSPDECLIAYEIFITEEQDLYL